jgi:hypothetical protein
MLSREDGEAAVDSCAARARYGSVAVFAAQDDSLVSEKPGSAF